MNVLVMIILSINVFRFCQECIITALRSGNKECPTCRKKLVSKRSLRPDPNFDALISKIYPCRDEYEAHQERVLARIRQSVNPSSMAENVEEGLRQQAFNRAQRVKKQTQGDMSQTQSGSAVSDDGSLPKLLSQMDSSSSPADDNSPSGDQLPSGSQVTKVSSVPPEIELVMRPHPQPGKQDTCDSQTRFIKTTSNATGNIYLTDIFLFKSIYLPHYSCNIFVTSVSLLQLLLLVCSVLV